jgi:hypothetical protein
METIPQLLPELPKAHLIRSGISSPAIPVVRPSRRMESTVNATTSAVAGLLFGLSISVQSASGDPMLYEISTDAADLFDGSMIEPVVRGQSPFYTGEGTTTYYQPPTYAPDGLAAPSYQGDPWLNGGAATPYVQPAPGYGTGLGAYGLNGPQPYRMGWSHSYEAEFLPSVSTSSPDVGEFGIFGVDIESTYTTTEPTFMPLIPYKVLSISPQFNYRSWDGPLGTDGLLAVSHLPGSVYRFGLDMRLATPFFYDWSAEIGFNPAVAADFTGAATSDAWMFDGHAVGYWRWGPQWMWALGAAYWDRVDGMVIPYAGAVWTPNEFWEFRLLFPESQISMFLGTPYGVATWLYLSAEYHVEAYQVDIEPTAAGPRTSLVQIEDWRLMGGLKWEAGWMTTFVECGYVFGRGVEFERVGTDFDPDSGFIGRVGIRF